MSRFLVTCWPLVSHVLPQLSIAAALRRAGHDVAFYTGEHAAPLVAREGYERFGFERVDERGVLDAIRELERRAGAGRPKPRDVRRCFDRWLVDPIADQVADVRDVIARWSPDVLVTDLSMWGPIVVLHETGPVPVALSSTFMGPLTPSRDAPPPGFGLPSPRGPVRALACRAASGLTDLVARRLRRRVDAIRAEHGLGPMGCSVNAYMGRLPLTLVPTLRVLDYGRRDVPDTVHYIGASLWHPPDRPEATRWLDSLPAGRPWVHVNAPTMEGGEPFLLRAAAEGLAGAPLEVVGTFGGATASADLRPDRVAPNIHLTDWVSHAELLPRCAVVVTSGGTGTIMSALAAGVPLVVVPTTWDKPDNAQRVVEAGVGVRLSPRRCTPERLRAAVEAVLAEPRLHRAAQDIARRLAERSGPDDAARLLGHLVPASRADAPGPAVPGGRR